MWRYPEGYIGFSKLGIFMLARGLLDEQDKGSSHLSIEFIYVRLENVHIWKGINIPSLLKYLDMAPLKLFSNNESIVAMV